MKRIISTFLIISFITMAWVSFAHAENDAGPVSENGSGQVKEQAPENGPGQVKEQAPENGSGQVKEQAPENGPGQVNESVPADEKCRPEEDEYPPAKTNQPEEITYPAEGIGQLESITYSADDVYETVCISAPGFTNYYITELADPLRIVIDMVDLAVPDGHGCIAADGRYIKKVRYAQFTEKTARVVLDVNDWYDYSIVRTDAGLTAYVCRYRTPGELQESKEIPLGPDWRISTSGSGADETVSIELGGYDEYSVTRLTEPERLIVTIPEAYVSSKARRIDYKGERVSYVEYAPAGRSGAAITIGLTAQFRYSAELTEGKLDLSFDLPTYRNITYSNSGDRVYFLIKKATLTSGTKNLKTLYKGSYDKSGKIYTVTFPTKNADINEGVLDINDDHLKSFEVRKNSDGTTSLVFTGRLKNSYLVYTRDSGDTAITVIRPAADGQRPVVIDAGHGGTATGARYEELYEKDLNLDIARRLESLLKSNGIRTYMMRSDDTNVDNYERAYIANMLGAELFISIHNNAASSKSIKGTMTLCYPSKKSGFTGRDLARIIQKEMVAALKTADKNVRLRPDLIVLRETYMPAALAEVAFMTNKEDRENLRRESFRQSAARALCSSVMEALERVA
jgi:N-acetylmuramoyl-L-alanine amidase